MLLNQVTGERLWIGGMYALRFSGMHMKGNGITHIVSVLRLPVDHRLFEGYGHLQIEVDDVGDENLLEHFGQTYDFINSALEAGGRVFIHCAMGKSRSATVLAAFLMRKRQISRDDAIAVIRETRPFVDPNDGFMKQLDLYHKMEYTTALDHHPIYQRWRYQQELETSRAAGVAPERIHFRDAEKDVARITQMAEGQTAGESSLIELRCKKCRRTLANSQFLTTHIPKAAQPPHPKAPGAPCAHHFLEPLRWMKPELDEGKLEGKLECPKCQSKVGSYAWQGMRCSCSEWIIPGISLARSRVDEIKVPAKRL